MAIDVTINGEAKTVDEDGVSVAALLEREKVKQPEMVPVQLNGKILRREQFVSSQVHDGDTVEFLYYMGGGGR